MASLTIENYVKTIYQLCVRQEGAPAATGKLADAMCVSPGTVTSMLKTLSDAGLAEYTPYEGVILTEAGRMLALRVLRRHRLIELFLARTLKLTWDEVHDEAENMEHAVSDLLVDRIDEYLGFPASDPHGDPIPRADGTIHIASTRSLDQWTENRSFRLIRVLDQTPKFLRYLGDQGLTPGTEAHLVARHGPAGTLAIRLQGNETTVSREVAEKLLVASVDGQ